MLSISDYKFTEEEEIDYIESLYEMATVARSQQNKLLVQVHPSECRTGDFYFKVFDSANEQRAKHIARIKFERPVYVIHKPKYNRGKDYWWLSGKDKRNLMDFLNTKSRDLPEYNNWQVSILLYNREKGLDFAQTQENLLSNQKLKYPQLLPFDLPMPNYELLPPNFKTNERILHEIGGKNLEESEKIAEKILSDLHS